MHTHKQKLVMLSLLKFRKLNTNERKILDQFTIAFILTSNKFILCENFNFIVGLTSECL